MFAYLLYHLIEFLNDILNHKKIKCYLIGVIRQPSRT